MKLPILKTTVYKLADVSSTQALKAKYPEIKPLDMRQKRSWEKALTIVQAHSDELATWLDNPPDEYKDLFAEIDAVSQRVDAKLANAKQLNQTAIAIANNLDQLADDYQAEADDLQREIKANRKIAKRASLN